MLIISLSLHASTFYVDARLGSDSDSGNSPAHCWKSLGKVNAMHYLPGDRILFRSGSRWEGHLALSSSGGKGAPIKIDRYGRGALPRIDGNGKVENVLQLENVEQVEVRHLEITNSGDQPGIRRGVLIAVTNYGVAHHLVVSDLYIHDVNGTNERKETGGILFRTIGDKVPSRFDGLLIERNIVWKSDRSAIVGQSNEANRMRWFPSTHVVIRDNFAEDIGGDGIVPWATDGALIEHNVVLYANQRAGSYNAGIWPWSTDRSLFQLNEAAFTRTTLDGEGFDSDYNSKDTQFRYNYSHDNDGGFMLICAPGKRNPRENIGNSGTVIKYNISRNDHARIFNLSGADNVLVEHNAIYVDSQEDVQVLLVSSWDGWSSGALFRANLFDIAGTGSYGHEVRRNRDGTYRINSGWGAAKDIRFEGNEYFGKNIDLPFDLGAVVNPNYYPAKLDWEEPVFDPSHPEEFPLYLAKHRNWMLKLFSKQFGEALHLGIRPHKTVED
ncbi:MAG: hypothetical protein P4K83_09985 [Terracidiphilus sp.]|nr:hypothetical protein [Terracidiphilus sp.]